MRKTPHAFTLVEVLVTIVIAAVILLTVIYGILFSIRSQKLAREHTLAQRQAASLIEEARATPFRHLSIFIDNPAEDTDNDLRTRNVLIDDQRTADTDDDLWGIARLHLYRPSGSSGNLQPVERALRVVTDSNRTVETIEDYLVVQAEITWESMGQQRRVTLITHFAP